MKYLPIKCLYAINYNNNYSLQAAQDALYFAINSKDYVKQEESICLFHQLVIYNFSDNEECTDIEDDGESVGDDTDDESHIDN